MKKLSLLLLLIVAINTSTKAQTRNDKRLRDYAKSIRDCCKHNNTFEEDEQQVAKFKIIELKNGTNYIRKADDYGRFNSYNRQWEEDKRLQESERLNQSITDNLLRRDKAFDKNIESIHNICEEIKAMARKND